MTTEYLRFASPNPECVMLCPVLDADRLAVGHGNDIADEDFARHCAQSLQCSGTDINGSRFIARCPLFGVEAKL